jgi:hypothetical protein
MLRLLQSLSGGENVDASAVYWGSAQVKSLDSLVVKQITGLNVLDGHLDSKNGVCATYFDYQK